MSHVNNNAPSSGTELCDLQQVIDFLWTSVSLPVVSGSQATVDPVCIPLGPLYCHSNAVSHFLQMSAVNVPVVPLWGACKKTPFLEDSFSAAPLPRVGVASNKPVRRTKVYPLPPAGTSSAV